MIMYCSVCHYSLPVQITKYHNVFHDEFNGNIDRYIIILYKFPTAAINMHLFIYLFIHTYRFHVILYFAVWKLDIVEEKRKKYHSSLKV